MCVSMDNRDNRRKQVRLTTFNNEPMARLAEQRLWQSDIPCLIRSLRGGPGMWGSSYNLPHDLYVFETDRDKAREVLELEHADLDQSEFETWAAPRVEARASGALWLAGFALATVLAVGMILRLTSGLP